VAKAADKPVDPAIETSLTPAGADPPEPEELIKALQVIKQLQSISRIKVLFLPY
jgi:hypothetical protein